MEIGDVVKIYAPLAGYNKYHFCICLPDSSASGKFLFLNSEPHPKDCLVVESERIAFLPPSPTGYTCISFSLLARYNAAKLALFEAEVLGRMPLDVVREMHLFLDQVKALSNADKLAVKLALDTLLAKADRTS